MSDEPKRPYYIPPEKRNKPIVLKMFDIIVKPLHINDGTTTHQIVATKPPTSRAAKQVIDN